MPFYAVKIGITPGIYNSWEECKQQVMGYSNPKYKKFNTIDECNAFMQSQNKEVKIKSKDQNIESYYSVHKGKNIGIFKSWDECKPNIQGFKGAKYKKFTDKKDAEFFLINGFVENEDNNDEIEVDPNSIKVYTDGSLVRLNGYIGCGYGIYIPKYNLKQGSILFENKTNNRAELLAIIDSIKLLQIKGETSITIYTDSSYSILIFGNTGDKYEKRNYKNVKNKDLVMQAQHLKKTNLRLVFRHVKAHTGNLEDEINFGNDVADKIANRNAVLDYINQDKEWKNRKMSIGKYNCEISNMDIDYLKTYISSSSYISLCKRDESFRSKAHILEIYIASI